LGKGIKPRTVNSELFALQSFLRFLNEQEIPICQRFLLLGHLEEAHRLPRDVPAQLLRLIYLEIQRDTVSEHIGVHRMGLMDTSWFLLMLHCGLRTCEVRSLKLADIDWEQHQIKIEQSKGLKDRLVYLSQAVIKALQNYLPIRGPADALPGNVFIFRHQPLSATYCYERLETYGERCGVEITPHQLRHSCATLLLNAGAPILTVQAILGHKQIDTTLGYARLYDGTIARDYFRAMEEVEKSLILAAPEPQAIYRKNELIALLDSLKSNLLTDVQLSTIQAIKDRISDLAY
jgi:integrase